MPWCPVCKNEYREGITECADCKVPLVDSLDAVTEDADEMLFSTENETLAAKFIEYLDYSDIHTHELKFEEENGLWYVYVAKGNYDTARKLFRGFALTENTSESYPVDDEDMSDDMIDELVDTDNTFSDEQTYDEESCDEDEYAEENDLRVSNSGGAFVKKEDQYKDYQFSALSCMIVGLAGIIFCSLNIFGMLNIVPALFSQIVMLAVFAMFFFGGIALYIKSKSIKEQIKSETDTIDVINEWLNTNITEEFFNELKDENVSDEINYFNYVEAVKEKMFNEFPDTDSSMAESLIDEFMNNVL